ncbi:MAG: class I SAM-dependent rRNA methyltransferase [Bacteroidales bacterium]|nr:class I SAM-dependent rRNA methyltransferase [Bacteroidales bacterium]
MKKVILYKGKEKSLLRFHPWVFSGAVAKVDKNIQNGDIVEVCDNSGNFLAIGHFHDNSIAVRVFSFEPVEPNYGFWKEKVQKALAFRQSIGLINNPETTMFRLVNGEGDGLPGLIIDIYDGNAVMQFHAYGMFLLKDTFVQILRELFPDIKSIYNKSGLTLTDAEDTKAEDELLYGEVSKIIGRENGIGFNIDVQGGQKTGFFLDQRDSRKMVGELAKGHRVLNMFCYSGGFSAYALRGGAEHVDSVDISRKAIELTDANIALLGEDAVRRHSSYCEDVFKFLENMPDHAYDLIVLDPPAFAKHHRVKEQGIKGYRNINRKAMEKLQPGGLLFTFSCSQAISIDDFKTIAFSAAALEHKNVRIVHQMQHAIDHPVSIYHPEGNYLKGLLLAIE